MTIPEIILRKPQNSFIAVSSDAVVGQAVAALLATRGQHWWKLLVRTRDGHWLGTTFGKLYDALRDQPDAANLKLCDLQVLEPVPALEWDRTDIETAEYTASHQSSTIAVIVKGQDLIGIIVSPRRDAIKPLSVGQLTELTGQYVDLKQYGAILLAASQNTDPEPEKKTK